MMFNIINNNEDGNWLQWKNITWGKDPKIISQGLFYNKLEGPTSEQLCSFSIIPLIESISLLAFLQI